MAAKGADGAAVPNLGKAYRNPNTLKLIYYTYMWKRRDRLVYTYHEPLKFYYMIVNIWAHSGVAVPRELSKFRKMGKSHLFIAF
ncbi:hypothetical protein L596_020398 [Steinernema carpocapsae]|uniref:Uncharacterized protein n=1 Tax=Steinernema carpocapsae TaxID=34508 RepID=A0A4U5MTK5_STECR|nr:hypothetical protein L596_020398 [Steinernema carpocapsae]